MTHVFSGTVHFVMLTTAIDLKSHYPRQSLNYLNVNCRLRVCDHSKHSVVSIIFIDLRNKIFLLILNQYNAR